MAWRNGDARHGTDERKITAKVLTQGAIKVPAGEFEALKIGLTGFDNGQGASADGPYVVKLTETCCYVGTLCNQVAREYEQRDSGNQLEHLGRHELTSFAVRLAGNINER